MACEPGDEDAGRLSSAILAALGVPSESGGTLDRVLEALNAAAPVDVCVFLDDLHELPAMSAGERFVGELSTRLPPHAHLVLSSRDPVPIPVARRRASGQVVDVRGDMLAFTDAEVAALAEQLGQAHVRCEGLGGWPSLVRLVLSAPAGSARQFLWEEVVAGLSPSERSGLLALAVLGSGSRGEVTEVAGCDVDVDRLVLTVPLLYQDEQGRLGAHELWADAVDRLFRRADVQVSRVAPSRSSANAARPFAWVRQPCGGGSQKCSGWRASRSCAKTSGQFRSTRRHDGWRTHRPMLNGTRERQLLELAARYAEHGQPYELDRELDALEAAFAESGDSDGHAVTLAVGAVAAHARSDMTRLVAMTQRIRALPAPPQDPLLQFFVGTFDAARAALTGDVEGSLRTIESIPLDRVPPTVRELATRLHVIMLVLAGRAEEAVSIGRSLRQSSNVIVQSIPSMLRWAAGDPSEYLVAAPRAPKPGPVANHPYRFFRAAHGAVVAASLGDRSLADGWRQEMEASIGSATDSRDSSLAVAVQACCKILDHDEDAVKSLIAGHLARHPLTDARGEAHLRNNLAIAYVASDTVREYWDDAALGPSHARARAIARHLLTARDGRLDRHTELASPSMVVTTLPLPWTVELAVRAHAAGCSDGTALVRDVATWLPAPTRRELEWLAAHGDATCRAAAVGLGEDLLDLTHVPLVIDVLGPLRLSKGDLEIRGNELRRGRVRTLLALLVLRGPVRRERICDLLWPDLAPATAARNLRVTLSHLRRLLDSDMEAPRSTSTIRSAHDSIELAGPPLVDTDLRRLEGHLAAANQAEQVGDTSGIIAHLTQAVHMWRGDPLVDLIALDELSGDIEYIQRSIIDACQQLGELQLIAGRFDEALRCAERSRVAAPYSERAHRLAIACHLQRRDRAGLNSAVRTTHHMLDELGVEPEAATSMLLRRAEVLLGHLPAA